VLLAGLRPQTMVNINRQPARLLSKGERPIADMAELPLVTRCIDCTNEQIRYHETHAQS
jgi:hypothetical protein